MIVTDRLELRQWREEDLAPFAAMNADPIVMEHFPAPLSREESDALVARLRAAIEERGFGFWAAARRDTKRFIGFVGLSVPRFDAHFTPCTEIGWRLARDAWGHGFATEAARAACGFGFEELGRDEIVSFTAVDNARSRRVMERIGMTRDLEGDFDHPLVEEGHRLRRHVLYRLARSAFARPPAAR